MNCKISCMLRVLTVALATVSTGWADDDLGGACGPVGSSQFLASMPAPTNLFQPTGPTYPEGIAVLANRVITSGPANFGTANNGSPTQLTVFNRLTGALLRQVPVIGEDLSQEHALSELYAWKNYVYSPSTQLGVLRWKFEGNKAPVQEQVSTAFPVITDPSQCALPPLPPLPNGIVVDEDGEAFVADSLQGAIWRIPAAKHLPVSPKLVLCSEKLRGAGQPPLGLFGANGIAIIDDYIYVGVSFGEFGTSHVYRLPKPDDLESAPTPDNLELVYTYLPVESFPGFYVPPIADGLRVDPVTEHLFVALAGQNQISELNVSGPGAYEVNRFSRTTPETNPPFQNGPPFLNPSTIDILPNGTAYVSNHAILCTLPNASPSANSPCNSTATAYFGVVKLCVR